MMTYMQRVVDGLDSAVREFVWCEIIKKRSRDSQYRSILTEFEKRAGNPKLSKAFRKRIAEQISRGERWQRPMA
jgi:hypothetical protein